MNPFVQYFELGGGLALGVGVAESTGEGANPVDQSLMSMAIADLDLSVRAGNCLESARIQTVGELVNWTEERLLELRSFGKTSLREIKRKLADYGLSLGMAGGSTAAMGTADLAPDVAGAASVGVLPSAPAAMDAGSVGGPVTAATMASESSADAAPRN